MGRTRTALYWTDGGDPPRGNSVNRVPVDPASGVRNTPEILFSRLVEGIGIALHIKGRRMFMGDFPGTLYGANLDGANPKVLRFSEGDLTGVAYVELPVRHQLWIGRSRSNR